MPCIKGKEKGKLQLYMRKTTSRQSIINWRKAASNRCVAIAKCRRSSKDVDLKICLWKARPSIVVHAKMIGEWRCIVLIVAEILMCWCWCCLRCWNSDGEGVKDAV